MAHNRLCVAFRKILIKRQGSIIAKYCSSQALKEQINVPLLQNFSKNLLYVAYPEVRINFIPKSLNIDFGIPNSSIKNNINELPLSKYVPCMEEPVIPLPIHHDVLIDKAVQLPSPENCFEKLAHRMIRIRRQKMKKHKKRKLRKRMKFVWAKIRARRNILKEKVFQTELVTKIKEAHMFDAKKYVEEKLAMLDKERLPLTYMGEILPPDMIRQFIKEAKERKEKRNSIPRLKLD